MKSAALNTAGTLFSLVAVAHLLRFAMAWEVVIDGALIPVWLSLPIGLLIGALAAWMFVAARR